MSKYSIGLLGSFGFQALFWVFITTARRLNPATWGEEVFHTLAGMSGLMGFVFTIIMIVGLLERTESGGRR